MNKEQTILVVEDDQIFGQRLRKAFLNRGFQVVLLHRRAQMSQCLQEHSIDYAVIDLCLPDGTGIDVLSELLESAPLAQAVILTGYGTIGTAVEAVKKGAKEFLTKPTNPDSILEVLQGKDLLIHREYPPQPTLAQVEWEHMHRVLGDCGGNVSLAAKVLGLHRRSLQRKLARDPGKLY